MTTEHIRIVDLPACRMKQDELDTLSYIFSEGKPFTRFVELYTWFMAGLPEKEQVVDFWAEVEGMT